MVRGLIILSAGGTGGHLFPAEALGHELTMRGWEVHLATDRRAQRFASAFPENAIHIIRSATISDRHPIAIAHALWMLWQGTLDARRLYRKFKPKLVVGFGGYPTLPSLYAAISMAIPTIIHEQNAVMGRANKKLATYVDAIAGGFLPNTGVPYAHKTVHTGNPLRPTVLAEIAKPYCPALPNSRFRLLIFGGSQGARFFSTALPAALQLLSNDLQKRLDVTQQARPEDETQIRKAYEELEIKAEISSFFNDMPCRIAEAHFVISRSGASTVSEIAAIGRPAVLVPFPHALDHDQAANAIALAGVGGAQVIRQQELDAKRLASIIRNAMMEPERLISMASAAKSVGRPAATRLLADLVEAIASGESISAFKKGKRP